MSVIERIRAKISIRDYYLSWRATSGSLRRLLLHTRLNHRSDLFVTPLPGKRKESNARGVLLGLMSVILALSPCAAEQGKEIRLRPPVSFVEAARRAGAPMPFYMALPMAAGEWKQPAAGAHLRCNGRDVPALVRVAAHWPDGSAQWLAIDGVWPAGMDAFSPAVLVAGAAPAAPGTPAPITVESRDGGVALMDAQGRRMALLTPEAKILEIVEPKAPDSKEPEALDAAVQYAWAEDTAALNPEGEPEPLAMRVREVTVEASNAVFRVYRVRGDGGPTEPGLSLEWQLRLRVYAAAPAVAAQMTWFLHGDPRRDALASARWTVLLDKPFACVRCAAARSAFPAGSTVTLRSTAPGRVRIEAANAAPLTFKFPHLHHNAWALERGEGDWLALAIPNFTRLGPNHLRVAGNRVEIAAWSGESGKAFDRRRTVTRDEFEMGDIDFEVDARGLARTLDVTFARAGRQDTAEAMALAAARRDRLWFASREDLVRSRALGPWSEAGYRNNAKYLIALRAQVHWVMASRDYWRWNGFANFGDIRTNWHRAEHAARGQFPMRWALAGRYGWRQGSADVYKGWLHLGLFTEDRAMILAARDYAAHVADVDVFHGRFGRPLTGRQGGMHRRNKNHWSGVVQTQYTPSRGLYLMRWLTGYERFAETLAEIRDHAARRTEGSIYSPGAWLNRYTETHDPADLARAEELLDAIETSWRNRVRAYAPRLAEVPGLAVMYARDVRRFLDCYPTLVEFHRATGDRKYLDAMVRSVQAHPDERADYTNFGQQYVIAYLLSHGVDKAALGVEMVDEFWATLENYMRILGARAAACKNATWDYETLTRKQLHTYQTAELGCRAAYAPTVMSFLETDGAPPEASRWGRARWDR